MLKDNKVDILEGPQNPAPMATTVINIQTETSVPDHIVWSLFNTIFMNWCCLGFVAFAYSVKVGVWVGGVLPESTGASTAKCLNIWALVLGILLTMIFIILFFTGALVLSVNTVHTMRQQRGYH
ncbi:interferon-induced transmembrane protein 1-like [Puma concolor]|uniref:Interferon-induced transmembrane protein 1-like n=1 Tax=Puma concolor TaxID=9696 RepID=A0A6P6H6F0_PUMCO|nr:interferon-induced transmembrane protein 1-like [Puma concolor]